MYYVIRNIDSYDCMISKFEKLEHAIEWADIFADKDSIITMDTQATWPFKEMIKSIRQKMSASK